MAKITGTINKNHYQAEIKSEVNSIISDESVVNGGKGAGFSPEQLLAASLASCTLISLRMYADRKEWPLEKIDVDVILERDQEKNITNFIRKIHFTGNLDNEQKMRLLVIADKCPIHKILTNQISITTTAS